MRCLKKKLCIKAFHENELCPIVDMPHGACKEVLEACIRVVVVSLPGFGVAETSRSMASYAQRAMWEGVVRNHAQPAYFY